MFISASLLPSTNNTQTAAYLVRLPAVKGCAQAVLLAWNSTLQCVLLLLPCTLPSFSFRVVTKGNASLNNVFAGPTPEIPAGFNPDIYNVEPELGFYCLYVRI